MHFYKRKAAPPYKIQGWILFWSLSLAGRVHLGKRENANSQKCCARA